MDRHIIPIQSDLYYLCMYGCRLFCVAKLFGITEEKVINLRHKLIDIGAIDTQYEILDISKLINFFAGDKGPKYTAYFISIEDHELIEDKVIIPAIDEDRGRVAGIFKKYISTYNGEYKYHWVLQFPDRRPDYNTVTTCTAIKHGHIDKKAVMVIYENYPEI